MPINLLKTMFKTASLLTYFTQQVYSQSFTSNCNAAKIEPEATCPSSRSEWNRRAKQKQCTEVVLPCKKKNALKYHCLINTWKNLTLSVCAVPTYIIGIIVYVYKTFIQKVAQNSNSLAKFYQYGVFFKKKTRETIRRFMFYIAGYYCPEFNIKGSSIQPHYDTNCSINIPACPFRYNSQDVYKCMFYLYTFCIRINCYLEDLLSVIVNLLINYFQRLRGFLYCLYCQVY